MKVLTSTEKKMMASRHQIFRCLGDKYRVEIKNILKAIEKDLGRINCELYFSTTMKFKTYSPEEPVRPIVYHGAGNRFN